MSANLLTDWPAILDAGPDVVGGKAWSLARLARYGFAVPSGMVLPAAAQQQWLEGAGLRPALLAAAARPEPERTTALATLRQELLGLTVAPALLAALAHQLGQPPWDDIPLAVRSSAPQEDSRQASFAGIHVSFLNVQGLAALARALREVWASLWSPAAVAYRERIGLPHEEAAMAVLVMPLVAARASGIAFTCDPLSGRDDRLVIHAAWGLGEGLVGGQLAGDEIVLAEDLLDDSLGVLRNTPGNKKVQVVPAAHGGTVSCAVAPAAARAPVLNDELALRLGELLRQAALALDYGHPFYDLEWAWDGQRFHLLQARPITVRNPCVYPALAGQAVIWTRGNTRDVVPDPLSPIDWSNSRRLVNSIVEQGYRLAGFPLHSGAQRAGMFHGRLYLNLSLIQWEAYAAFGLAPAAMNRLLGGHQPEITLPASDWRFRLRKAWCMLRFVLLAPARRRAGRRAAARAMATTSRWNTMPPPQSDAAAMALMRGRVRHIRRDQALHFLQGASGGALALLVDLLNARLPGQGHGLAAALLAGDPPSVTARQGYDLVALSRTAMADPIASDWLARRQELGYDWHLLPPDNPFRSALAAFLERYGHRGVYESYVRNPRWREQPQYLLDSLAELAGIDLAALAAARAQVADSARARVRAALPWWQRPLLAPLRRAAKDEANDREAARSALIAYIEPGRRQLLTFARQWVERGWLSVPDDIFFLLTVEIVALLEGTRPAAGVAALVADRRRQFVDWLASSAPDVMLEEDNGGRRAIGAGEPQDRQEGADVFHGVPVGGGRAVGTARLLRSPEEGLRLGRGEILVVPSTDPAWTPLFLRAGGLVMETGGFLSHGAIVAREFGIPAVANLPGILELLRDGDRLEVDGGRGRVRRLAQGDPMG
ncbi:MAG: hypothetical protein BWK76_14895 [Desulfobulbaceae bacterium A2]|nr:MAG: hypothetical protein BWK76_14895 [Desulfobulbaceae bacterium A2]